LILLDFVCFPITHIHHSPTTTATTTTTMSYDYDALVHQIEQARQRAEAMAVSTDAADCSKEELVLHLEQALQSFQELASHCPMTPRLWIQYAETVRQHKAVSSQQQQAPPPPPTTPTTTTTTQPTPLDIVQQGGLQQFPGSALLHLYHCCYCVVGAFPPKTNFEDHFTSTTTKERQQQQQKHALELAIDHLGHGLHGHGSVVATLVAPLYPALAKLQLQQGVAAPTTTTTTTTTTTNNGGSRSDSNATENEQDRVQAAQATLIRRALEPLDNDTLTTLAQELLVPAVSSSPELNDLEVRLDRARRWTARNRAPYASYESDLQIALQRQGMVEVPVVPITKQMLKTTTFSQGEKEEEEEDYGTNIPVDWDALIRPSHVGNAGTVDGSSLLCGMGTGNVDTANAFIQYAQAVARDAQREWKQSSKDEEDDDESKDVDRALHPQRSELVVRLYERGVAECPTVERIWLSYLAHVTHCIRFWQQQQGSSQETTTTSTATTAARIAIYASRLESIGQRAVRNCPYSVSLVQERLRAHLLQAQVEQTVFDPDLLLEWIQTAWDRKFLVPSGPGTFWTLYATALRMVTRRILTLLTPRRSKFNAIRSYDDAEEVVDDTSKTAKKKASSSQPAEDDAVDEELDETAEQELDDLVDDLDDMYEEIERRMKQAFPSWSQGRAVLAMDRAQLATYLLRPLRRVREGNGKNVDEPSVQPHDPIDPALAAWQKATRTCQPPHPDLYLGYIRCFQQVGPMKSPRAVARLIRQTRYLFQTAVHAVGQAKKAPSGTEALLLRDYPTALSELCHAWTEFESLLGSEESLDSANKTIRKKWEKTVATSHGQLNQRRPIQSNDEPGAPVPTAGESKAISQEAAQVVSNNNQESCTTAKRKPAANLGGEDRPSKRTRLAPLPDTNASDAREGNVQEVHEEATEDRALDASAQPKEEVDQATSLAQKSPEHKVRIGKLDYPAHPFTVRISHLSPKTEDMDLVDLLRPKCGAIVHARIIRDKGPPHAHYHGGPAAPKQKSKGWALVQFEERESVEKALALDDIIGLHEKVLRIERSHQPAATLVPPGMHRVNPKGDGKHSKRNEKKREAKAHFDGEDSHLQPETPSGNTVAAIGSETPPAQGAAHAESTASSLSVLAFRPRGLQRKEHQKKRLNLDHK